jgi:MSHA biogenesis protein MshK
VFKLNVLSILICGLSCLITQTLADTDPTSPFGYNGAYSMTPESQKLVLESIIHGDGVNTVVISGKVLSTFDHIGEYQLTAINAQSVILRSETERLKLHIFKNDVVKVKIN